MDESTSAFAILIAILVAVLIIYLVRKFDEKNKYTKEENDSNTDENINEKNKSQDEQMTFESFLNSCDSLIENIDELHISDETRNKLELCYEWHSKKVNEIPFSIIIQSDIIRFLFMCRFYTACLNQQKNKPIYDYFNKDFPKECVNHLMVRIVTDAIVYDNENYKNIELNDVLPSILVLAKLVKELVNSDISSPLIKKNDYIGSTSWILIVIAYISKIMKPFFEYGLYHATDYEYENVSKCMRELLKVPLLLDNEEETKSSIALKSEQNVTIKNYTKSNEKNNLDILLNELNSLIGLSKVKEEVNTLINLVTVRKKREEQGLKPVPLSLHLVFSGNPGTGKTTVARILAKIYKEIGVLSKGQLIETDRSGLVAGYVGQTALKTQEVIEQAKGGILFIDEAYSLASSKDSNDFGKEAIDTLLKAMEDMRDDFIVIVAGYPDLMKQFLKSNPGLESRFNNFIDFEDYQPKDLVEIFKYMCNEKDYIISEVLNNSLLEYFNELYLNRDDSYANARTVRNVFENTLKKQANRVAMLSSPSKQDLQVLLSEDLL